MVALLVSIALATCVDDSICTADERTEGCSDCSFGDVCVDDGACTTAEMGAGCSDCAAVKVNQCVDDSVCTADEKALGDCADCQAKQLDTGLLIIVGGIGIVGFLVMAGVIAFIVIGYVLHVTNTKRIRL